MVGRFRSNELFQDAQLVLDRWGTRIGCLRLQLSDVVKYLIHDSPREILLIVVGPKPVLDRHTQSCAQAVDPRADCSHGDTESDTYLAVAQVLPDVEENGVDLINRRCAENLDHLVQGFAGLQGLHRRQARIRERRLQEA